MGTAGLNIWPLLFTIMVSDLPHVVSKCQIMLYADSAVLFYSSPNPEEIEKNLNSELKSVHEREKVKRMALKTC